MEQQFNTTSRSQTRIPNDEHQILQSMDLFAHAVRNRDLTSIMSAYTEDAVIFDVRDALQIDKNGLRRSWQECFESSRDFKVEFAEPHLKIEGNLAINYFLSHSTGTTKDGAKIDIWLRLTHCWVKRNGHWLITHEHTSVPGDFGSGQILQGLKPNPIH